MKSIVKIPQKVLDAGIHKATVGIIEILMRAYAQHCKMMEEEDGIPFDFIGFCDSIQRMTPEEFASIPLMSKAEYYGE